MDDAVKMLGSKLKSSMKTIAVEQLRLKWMPANIATTVLWKMVKASWDTHNSIVYKCR
jgi:hypothetical protein